MNLRYNNIATTSSKPAKKIPTHIQKRKMQPHRLRFFIKTHSIWHNPFLTPLEKAGVRKIKPTILCLVLEYSCL